MRRKAKAAPASSTEAGTAAVTGGAVTKTAAGTAARAGGVTGGVPTKTDPGAGGPAAGDDKTRQDTLPGDKADNAGKGDKDVGDNAGKVAAAQAPATATRSRGKPPLPTDRPPGAPPDPWTAFARTSERAPGRLRRAGRVIGRGLIHEYSVVVYVSLLLAVAFTWPTLRYPLHTVPQDISDPARQAWQIAWTGHILRAEPARLWQSNAFYPERYNFAFGDSLLGYAPAGLLGDGPAAALLRYNILFVLAHALLLIGGYALIRQLGAGRTGSAVAALAVAFAPWRLAQEGHLDLVSAGGIPLALAMLARGHGWSMRYGFRPEHRNAAWAAAGWVVATWQFSLGFSLGLPFAIVLAGVLLVIAVATWIKRLRSRSRVLGWQLLVTNQLGALIFLGVGALIAVPYLRTTGAGPATPEIEFYSPPWRSLFIAPAESRIWGGAHAGPRSSLAWPAETTLLPGFALYALALVGLVFSIWKLWHRLVLLAGLAVAVILTLGTTFFEGRWTYLPLFGHLPASFGVRVPGRLMLWVTLLLAVLAAGAVAEFVRRAELFAATRIPPWPGPWLRLATFVPLVLILVETVNATPHPLVPAQPAAMRSVSGPMLVLPTSPQFDQVVMLWTTSRFPEVANGGGGFAANQQAELRRSVENFPDTASIQYLREAGISSVLLVRSQAAGTPWEAAGDVAVDSLGIRREDVDDNTVLFTLN